ncbi:hypothetical protein [Brevundimonas sp. UBA7664]|uniref:hypothetical protein n=1 Tax=Brevundimonas sp. UBA7664 TaxID=1946141 RepID=UPI0025C4F966|nr:hypothetical protein [Brevundimonas sp. UBA7664]
MTAAVPLDLDWLMAIHTDKRLFLTTADRSGFIFMARENPADEAQTPTVEAGCAYVTELIRLARIGQNEERRGAAT